jgi:hypothetical protein
MCATLLGIRESKLSKYESVFKGTLSCRRTTPRGMLGQRCLGSSSGGPTHCAVTANSRTVHVGGWRSTRCTPIGAREAVVGQTGVLCSQCTQRLSYPSRSIALFPPASRGSGGSPLLGVLTTRRRVLPTVPTHELALCPMILPSRARSPVRGQSLMKREDSHARVHRPWGWY